MRRSSWPSSPAGRWRSTRGPHPHRVLVDAAHEAGGLYEGLSLSSRALDLAEDLDGGSSAGLWAGPYVRACAGHRKRMPWSAGLAQWIVTQVEDPSSGVKPLVGELLADDLLVDVIMAAESGIALPARIKGCPASSGCPCTEQSRLGIPLESRRLLRLECVMRRRALQAKAFLAGVYRAAPAMNAATMWVACRSREAPVWSYRGSACERLLARPAMALRRGGQCRTCFRRAVTSHL